MVPNAELADICVFCPEHKRSFYVQPVSQILCEDRSHALAQDFPDESFWEYCCDCQRFRPSEINSGVQSESQCPVCHRQAARRYLCNECKVISVESDDRTVKRKRYNLTATGAVSPACPGCAALPPHVLNRHACDETGATVWTARDVCPFCEKPTKVEEVIEKKSEPKPRVVAKAKAAPALAVAVAIKPTQASPKLDIQVCPQCGAPNKPDELFCAGCGRRVAAPVFEIPSRPEEFRQPALPVSEPVPKTGTKNTSTLKILMGVLGGIVLLIIVVTVASLSIGGNTIEKKLDAAITKGNLLGSSTDSAYSLYSELKRSGATEDTLKRYREKLTPLLTKRGYQLTTDILILGYDEPPASDWQEAGQSLNWAVELNPGNNYMSARASYCNGRAAFVQKLFDQAIPLWTKAASLDKSWALPVNGLGLIHNSKRDYPTARSYFSEAIKREPNWAVPYENMANAYYTEKNRYYAREFYNQALAKSPDWAKPHVHLADMAMEDRDYATAVSEYELALSSNARGLKGQEASKVQERLDIARQRLSAQP